MVRALRALVALGVATIGAAAAAQTAPAAAPAFKSAAEIPVSQFFALEAYRDLRLSPDGKKLLAVVPIKGRGNLAVIDLEKRTSRAITSSDRWDVWQPRWIGSNRIYFRVVDGAAATGDPRLKGAYSIDPDGSDLREILGYNDSGQPVGMRIDAILSVDAEDTKSNAAAATALVAMRERSRDWVDVYRLDFRTLRRELVTFETPGRTVDWTLDNADRPRFAVRFEPRPGTGKAFGITHWHRAPKGGAWEKVFEFSSFEDGLGDDGGGVTYCGFADDDRIAYVTARRDRDKAALWTYDTETKKFVDLVLEDPVVDLTCSEDGGGLIRDPESKKIVGFGYDAGMPKRVYFERDNAHLKLLEQLRTALPGHIRFRLSPDGKRALVLAESDVDPGAYYLLDRGSNRLEKIVDRRPWFKPEQMAERRFITYKARDGLVIPAYLTLPRGADPKKLPLIINIHGGPHVRSYAWAEWGRWPEAQFFASRGYAVLEPEPRGSTQFGRRHFTSAWKQWGLSMQDDITDGALHLVSEGIVDRSRMCLHGGSYGGYATLQGLVREPDLFKCGHAFVAVTDLSLMQSVAWSDIAQDTRFDYLSNEFTVWTGDRTRDAELFERNSPARNADKIKAPVMITMGSDDVRVPLIHGERMRDALRRAGKPVEWKVYAAEGHGFNKEANVTDFYTRTLRFYDEHIGPNRKPAP
jgi:dipeptidyl aminopeptidase/acylaminoacyl peptidase